MLYFWEIKVEKKEGRSGKKTQETRLICCKPAGFPIWLVLTPLKWWSCPRAEIVTGHLSLRLCSPPISISYARCYKWTVWIAILLLHNTINCNENCDWFYLLEEGAHFKKSPLNLHPQVHSSSILRVEIIRFPQAKESAYVQSTLIT